MRMLFVVLMVLSFGVSANECKIQSELTNEQWYNVAKGFYAGHPHDLGLTLAAIIIKESQAGLYRVNPESKDYGLTNVNIKTAIRRLGYEDTPFMRSVAATKITFDDDLAIDLAIEELLYWKKRHNDYSKMIASYNAGNNVEYGLRYYYPQIAALVVELKPCFRGYSIVQK